MKSFRNSIRIICLILAGSFSFFSAGCTTSSNASNDDPNSGSIAGTWTLKSIQCLSVASDNSLCWKSFLLPLGEINMQSSASTVLTISADGTFSGDEIPKIDTLPKSIFACESNSPHSSKQHLDGTFTAAEGLIIIHPLNYLVNGQRQSSFDDDKSIDGTYTIASSTLTLTLDLGNGERWKVNFIK
jgi:hypothetical protein